MKKLGPLRPSAVKPGSSPTSPMADTELAPVEYHGHGIELGAAKHELYVGILVVDDLANAALVVAMGVWEVDLPDGVESLVLMEGRQELRESGHDAEGFVALVQELEPFGGLEHVYRNLDDESLVDEGQLRQPMRISSSAEVDVLPRIAIAHRRCGGPDPHAAGVTVLISMLVLLEVAHVSLFL